VSQPPEPEPALRRLEGPKRLSESLLWTMEAAYYEASGIAAWSPGGIPFTMTNSPALARTYVQLVEGLVEDCLAGRMGPFDPGEPLYVVDLGSGTGRLGYHVAEGLAGASLGPAKVVTVLTDRVEANVEYLAGHGKLRALLDAGRLDVAAYDVGVGGPLRLRHAGRELRPGTLANPLVAIANYLFDVLPQDLYRVTAGGLREELVELYTDDEPRGEGWELADHLYLGLELAPVPADRYPPRLRAVLDAAAAGRSGEGERFLFPGGAVAALDRIRELASDRLLFLVAERDDADLPPATGAPAEPWSSTQTLHEPGVLLRLASYGTSFSLPVDLGILEQAVRAAGGELLRGRGSAYQLAVAAVVSGDGGGASSVRARFANSVTDVAPDDVYRSVTAALAAVASSGKSDDNALAVLLAAIRLSGYDAVIFASCFRQLAACLPPPAELADEAVRVMERVNELNYWIRPQGDTAYAVGTLVGRCGRYERALELLDEARRTFGPRPDGHLNAAMCLMALDRVDEALASLDACLALDPGHESAARLRDRILAGDVSPPEAVAGH
jgi:hypothetical protein